MEYIRLTWIDISNQAAKDTLNAAYSAFSAYCRETQSLAAAAHAQLSPGEPLPAGCSALSLPACPTTALWSADAIVQLCSLPLTAAIELGTVEEVARRGAANFVAACDTLINTRIDAVIRSLAPTAAETDQFSACLAAMEEKYAQLCRHRAQLAEESEMLLRLLSPKKKEEHIPAAESETEADAAPQEESDTVPPPDAAPACECTEAQPEEGVPTADRPE